MSWPHTELYYMPNTVLNVLQAVSFNSCSSAIIELLYWSNITVIQTIPHTYWLKIIITYIIHIRADKLQVDWSRKLIRLKNWGLRSKTMYTRLRDSTWQKLGTNPELLHPNPLTLSYNVSQLNINESNQITPPTSVLYQFLPTPPLPSPT